MENQQKIKSPINESHMKYMANPRAFTLKKWFAGILQNKMPAHDQIIERVSTSLVTDGDLKAFGELMGALYEVGYMKAVNDYKKELQRLGIKTKISSEEA
mgnify:CR=1 FL=1